MIDSVPPRMSGVTKLLNVVHEIFLLLHSSHATYLWEHFDVPQE